MAWNPSYRAPAAADVHDVNAIRPPAASSPLADFGAKDIVVRDGMSREVHRDSRGAKLNAGDEIHFGQAIVIFEEG